MRGLCFALELALPIYANGGVGVLNPASELEAVMQEYKGLSSPAVGIERTSMIIATLLWRLEVFDCCQDVRPFCHLFCKHRCGGSSLAH